MSESAAPIDDEPGARDVPGRRPGTANSGGELGRGRLVSVILGYSLLRFGLTAVLTVALMFLVPLIIAMAIAVVVQLPLSMLLFARQGEAARAALAELRAERRAERAALRGALYGGERDEGDAAAR